jgi:hypothetical protein
MRKRDTPISRSSVEELMVGKMRGILSWCDGNSLGSRGSSILAAREGDIWTR